MNMACTHLHIPTHALDTFAITSGVYFGSLTYFFILFSSASSSLDLSKFLSWPRRSFPSSFFAVSQFCVFFRTIMTPFMHSSTSSGGLEKVLSTSVSFFWSTFSASTAASSAGIALSRPAWHSAATADAASVSFAIFAFSPCTCFSCSSASRFSATIVTRSSSHCTLASATTTFCPSAFTCNSPTFTSVSASFNKPPRSFCALPWSCARFSPSNCLYPFTNSR